MAVIEYALSLGSNLGDRLACMREARRRLEADPDLRVTASSPLYETEPVDVSEEHRSQSFLNAVLLVESPVVPRALNERLHGIEAEMGRVRVEDRNAPRPIDIDILYADDRSIHESGLQVPHPRWSERRFVVQPLCDVRPDRVLPGETRTVSDVLLSLPPKPEVVLFQREW